MGSEVEVIVASSAIHHWSEYAVQVEVEAFLSFGQCRINLFEQGQSTRIPANLRSKMLLGDTGIRT